MSDRVLAIDDEPGVLRLLSRALRSEGLEIDTATNGEEGLRLALTGSYSVVILDLLMPGTDGMSVLRRLMRLRPDQARPRPSDGDELATATPKSGRRPEDPGAVTVVCWGGLRRGSRPPTGSSAERRAGSAVGSQT